MEPSSWHEDATQAWLQQAWNTYAQEFIQEDGRVIDHHRDEITTSEGQAYALLQTAWLSDKASFERIHHWTVNNLQGGNPTALPAWRWGKGSDGNWGVQDPNSASDADQLLAYALLLGAERFQKPIWKTQAQALITQIWEQEVMRIHHHWVILPGAWARQEPVIRLNPSYFLPFAWHVFAKVDPDHPWSRLTSDMYFWLDHLRSKSGLPPDWVAVDPHTGRRKPLPEGSGMSRDFSYDAFRVLWNLAAEARWYKAPKAKAELAEAQLLWKNWSQQRHIPSVIAPDGSVKAEASYVGMYGAILPALALISPKEAELLYTEMLKMRAEGQAWGSPGDYYAPNWVWFGVALWSGVATPAEVR